MTDAGGIDVIVRFHDVVKLQQLDRALFSLVTQSYRPLHIHLVTQRFTPAEMETTEKALVPMLSIDNAPRFSMHNWTEVEPHDARSALANVGFSEAKQQYLALLDYDDVLYPEAYEKLIGKLRESGKTIAFGGICIKDTEIFEEFYYTRGKQFPFNGIGEMDLFRSNFCPVHSFVIDRTKVPSQLCFFEPLMTKNEDYDFLLRICARCPADFSLTGLILGDYRIKSDGSNTILTNSAATSEGIAGWLDAEAFVEARRRTTPLSAAVQMSLGIAHPISHLTIRSLLDRGLDELRSASPSGVG